MQIEELKHIELKKMIDYAQPQRLVKGHPANEL
jgi:hypothetical protein